jgi:RHS repeat-associated protein
LGERIKKTTSGTSVLYPFGDDYEINGGVVTKYISATALGMNESRLGVIAKKVGSDLFWIHSDKLGSVNAVTDSTGAEQLRRSYRAYGEILGTSGSHAESRGWIDQRTDSETNGSGLTYLHARYYDSQLGMFVSADLSDPLDQGVGFNRFGYGGGSPTLRTDRTGLRWSREDREDPDGRREWPPGRRGPDETELPGSLDTEAECAPLDPACEGLRPPAEDTRSRGATDNRRSTNILGFLAGDCKEGFDDRVRFNLAALSEEAQRRFRQGQDAFNAIVNAEDPVGGVIKLTGFVITTGGVAKEVVVWVSTATGKAFAVSGPGAAAASAILGVPVIAATAITALTAGAFVEAGLYSVYCSLTSQ